MQLGDEGNQEPEAWYKPSSVGDPTSCWVRLEEGSGDVAKNRQKFGTQASSISGFCLYPKMCVT